MDSERNSTQKDTSSSAVASSLSDLIARLEKATGPDRELGNDVLLACGWVCEEHGNGGPDTYLTWAPSPDDDDFLDGDHPDPTSSIDAAMTLVPDGMENDFTDLYGIARVSVGINANPGPFYGTHEGGSLAIALCIAALRARSQIESLPANDSAETRLEI